jgi:alpha-beta hydrolase superfamily lysophospholipase
MDTPPPRHSGMALCTAILKPKELREPKGVVFFCHGFGDHVSFMKRYNMFTFVREGLAVATIEYEGHGRSDGPLGLIPDFNQLVGDVVDYFQEVSKQHFPGKKCFLMGEVRIGVVTWKHTCFVIAFLFPLQSILTSHSYD